MARTATGGSCIARRLWWFCCCNTDAQNVALDDLAEFGTPRWRLPKPKPVIDFAFSATRCTDDTPLARVETNLEIPSLNEEGFTTSLGSTSGLTSDFLRGTALGLYSTVALAPSNLSVISPSIPKSFTVRTLGHLCFCDEASTIEKRCLSLQQRCKRRKRTRSINCPAFLVSSESSYAFTSNHMPSASLSLAFWHKLYTVRALTHPNESSSVSTSSS
mmetsp:Transcript_59856/g.151608  ORF Transcript_59856/g.151608 Transcript_59856/m.151608 type:complete len:217 (-) Transcript_59856:1281-1931(-)